ncbi:MAG: sugar phosphate nucleotidyltransferase [Armatimonadota bacterium]|jgi:UTP--glucose-1-phosphate uridylyltransferase
MTANNVLRKAIIPAAGRGTRQFPASRAVRKELFPLVDRDGVTRAAMHLIVREALSAGVEEVCIVASPGAEAAYRDYFRSLTPEEESVYGRKAAALTEAAELADLGKRITYRIQEQQLGLGHAVWCARDFADGEPVLVLLGDHVYVSETEESCAAQLADAWRECAASVSAVHPVGPEQIHLYGIVRTDGSPGPRWRVREIVEKPDRQTAERSLISRSDPALPYLAFFGMHVLQQDVFDALNHLIEHDIRDHGEYQLTTAQSLVAGNGDYYAVEVAGQSLDFGVPSGLALTQAVLTSLGPFAEVAVRARTRQAACPA